MASTLLDSPDAASESAASRYACRHCGRPLVHSFVDLGMSPLCESYRRPEQLGEMEAFYPLHAYVCDGCWLVQLPAHVSGEAIFSDYAYFSSYSDSWLAHARRYCEQMIERFELGPRSQVIEIASNDGYLLQNFVARGVPALGIEPAGNVAQAAIAKGVPTRVMFFGRETARQLVDEGLRADLLLGNNVLAHVPDLNGFVAGLATLLAQHGVVTMEFPHLMCLVEQNQFDTIYQEHYCYLSLVAVQRVFAAQRLTIFDVEELSTHGGSLRIYARHADAADIPVQPAVAELLARERAAGYERLKTYQGYAEQVARVKRDLLSFLIEARRAGKRVAGYGAPGKGNTLLNYCGIRTDLLEYTVDRSPYKQGLYLPGTGIPIHAPERLFETKPDYVLILPWNLKEEISVQMAGIRRWGGQFVVAIPELSVC